MPGCRVQQGLTLVELMIALALSLLLTAVSVAFFVSQKESSVLTAAVADVQQQGQVALELLTQDLRLAGYQGCVEAADGGAVNAPGVGYTTTTDMALRGFETAAAGWSAGEALELTELDDANDANGEVVAGTDVVMVSYLDPDAPSEVTHAAGSDTFAVPSAYSARIPRGALFMVANCIQAEVLLRTDAPDSSDALDPLSYASADGLVNAPLSFAYPANGGSEVDGPGPTRLGIYRAGIYYIGDTGRRDSAGNPVRALYRKSISRQPGAAGADKIAEIIAGVENLQVTYAQSDADGNRQFVDADAADLAEVEAVRVRLITRSTDAQSLRREFAKTVTIRNRRGG